MLIRFGFEIAIDTQASLPLVLALSPHSSYRGRIIGGDRIRTDPPIALGEYVDSFGNRRARLVAPPGQLRLWSDDLIRDSGAPDPVHPQARQMEIAELPAETLPFLTASRYCESDLLSDQAWALFAGTPPGWARVQAIVDFVHSHITFGYGFGRPTKTAAEVMREGTGVCRDFAHLAVALCRAMNIPARYASGYLGDIGVPPSGPGDFCAWFEAYLDGAWHTFDARYNMPRIGRVLMVRGRDAADVPMMTSFGDYRLTLFRVWTDEVPGQVSDMATGRLLAVRPDAPALTLENVG